jgi:hypothetical protein
MCQHQIVPHIDAECIKYYSVKLICHFDRVPWEEARGKVDDLMAGLVGLLSKQ